LIKKGTEYYTILSFICQERNFIIIRKIRVGLPGIPCGPGAESTVYTLRFFVIRRAGTLFGENREK
jgi:hypothetical protein